MSETKLVFFLVGARRRVGKDTFAGFLCDAIRESGNIVYPMSFAGALKEELNYALKETNWPDSADTWTEDQQIKEDVIRPLLIAWGNGRRYYNPDHWVGKVIVGANARRNLHLDGHAAADLPPAGHLFVVVSDWRFPNELTRLRDAAANTGDYVSAIHLSRRDAPEGTPDEIVNDPLCRKLADTLVANDGELETLRSVAKAVLRTFLFRQDNQKTS